MRRLVLVLGFLVLAPAAHAGTPVAGFSDTQVAGGLNQPTALAFLPDGRMLVTEKGTGGGTVAGSAALKLINAGTVTTLTSIPVCTGSEMGLLGIAVDPSFTTNGFVYLYRTAPDAGNSCADSVGRFNQVVRVTMSGNTVVPGSLTQLQPGVLQMRTDNGNHDGGGLRIGPDNKLYVAVGDTGLGDGGPPGASTNPYSQDLNALEGKVLRLELNGTPAAGNPYIGVAGRDEIWASGLRNPYRFGFDPQTGSLWLGDVGQQTIEELDIIVAGGDYAWPHCEGTLPMNCQANVPGPEPVVDPIFEYYQPGQGTPSLGRTITGGAFSGASFGSFAGHYFFGDYVASKIYRAVPNGPRNDIVGIPTDFVTDTNGPVDIVFNPGGALYYVSINSGEVRAVTPNYARPTSATPITVRFVPASAQCTSTNSTHGAPLALSSCNPPVQTSNQVTVGTPDGNGEAANSAGSLVMQVVGETPIDPGNGDQANVNLTFGYSDVRRKSDLADYAGELRALLTLRVTDRYSGPGLDTSATTASLPFGVTVPCSTTPLDSTTGSNCNVTTTADAVTANSVREGRRSIWELGQVQVFDGGADGDADTTGDNTLFAVQGAFVP